MTWIPNVDVAIVGAGTAGVAAAYQCARRGMKVVCLEQRPLEESGARWINGVASWLFEAADIPEPPESEFHGKGGRFHLIAGTEGPRIDLDQNPLDDLDMRHLGLRLQGLARDAGAELIGGVSVAGLSGRDLSTSEGIVTADVVIDASGLAGAKLAGDPALAGEHICTAAQYVHAIDDADAAADWLGARAAEEGDTICFGATAGGYSIINVHVHEGEISLLTGSIPALGHRSGTRMLEGFVAEHDWIGERIFGGARAIPIRRPWQNLALGRVGLIGDAACQVFPAHGSGIGAGMVAGRILAEALEAGEGLAGYNLRWQREWGGLFGAFDAFRRFTQTLTISEFGTLLETGLLDEASVFSGISQKLPSVSPSQIPGQLRGLAEVPHLLPRLGVLAQRMATSLSMYKAYPSRPGPLRAWSRVVDFAFGDRPDPFV